MVAFSIQLGLDRRSHPTPILDVTQGGLLDPYLTR